MIFLYLIFFFLILRFTVTLFNFISNPKLTPTGKHYTDLVSILIPEAADEEDLFTLLQSIRAQDYKNYEVLLLNRSFNVLYHSELKGIAADKRFKFLEPSELSSAHPDNNIYADQLSKKARGSYLVFPDPRSIVATGLINNAVHRMKIQQLALLGLYSNQIMFTIGERLVVPLINYLLLSLVPLRLIRLSKNPAFAISSGQFLMFDAQIYKNHNWMGLTKNKKHDDTTDLMKQIKSSGYHTEVLLANGFLYSRMYSGFTEAISSLSNTIISNFGSLTALLIYIFLAIAGPAAMAVFMDIELLLFAVTLIVLSRIMISLASGQNAWLNVLLHPLQMLCFLLIFVIAVPKHFTRSVTRKQRNMGY